MTNLNSKELLEGVTPGDWEARRSHIHVEGKGTVATVSNPWNNYQEREANARLIASAPRLARRVIELEEAFLKFVEASERNECGTQAFDDAYAALTIQGEAK